MCSFPETYNVPKRVHWSANACFYSLQFPQAYFVRCSNFAYLSCELLIVVIYCITAFISLVVIG